MLVEIKLIVYDDSKVLVLIHTLNMHTVDERGSGDIITLAPEVNTKFLSLTNIELKKIVITPSGKPLNSEVVVLKGGRVFKVGYYSCVIREFQEECVGVCTSAAIGV